MTSVVVSDGGGNIVEYVTVVEEPQQVSLFHPTPAVLGSQQNKAGLYANFFFFFFLPRIIKQNEKNRHTQRNKVY